MSYYLFNITLLLKKNKNYFYRKIETIVANLFKPLDGQH